MELNSSEVVMVINGYIRDNGGTLNTMSTIFRQMVGADRSFTRWDEAEKSFQNLNWTEERSRRFLEYARTAIEGGQDIISQSYLDILQPEEVSADLITNQLDENAAVEDESGRTGFTYTKRQDGIIDAEYYYYNTDVHVTPDFSIDSIPDQKRIPLRFVPSKRLVIVRMTQPSKVVKINSILSEETDLKTSTTGDIRVLPKEDAKSVIRDFILTFETSDKMSDGGNPSTEPIVDTVNEVDMYNPDMDESNPVQKADLEGEYHIFDSDEVNDLRDDGWYERGVGAKMKYRGRIYQVKVAGKERIGYVKLSDIEDIDRGRELLEKLRSRYLQHFRVLPQTKGIF